MSKKHVYSFDDIVFTEAFAAEKYATSESLREYKRKKKRIQKDDKYALILDFIDHEHIMDFYVARRRITSEHPELLEAFYEKWNMVKSYCDSIRLAKRYGYEHVSYDQLFNSYYELKNQTEKISVVNAELRQEIEEFKAENLALRKYVCEVAGGSGDTLFGDFWRNFNPDDYIELGGSNHE